MNQKVLKLFSILCFLVLGLSTVHAADILGCPNGIPKGTIWPRLTYKHSEMKEKWDPYSNKMVKIGNKTQNGSSINNKVLAKTKQEVDFRLGYGLFRNFDIGINMKYQMVETEKQKVASSDVSNHTFDESALTELWLSAKYIFIDAGELGIIDYFKLSAGGAYGFSTVSDTDYLVAGLTSGADKAQFGLLTHGGLGGIFDFAGHVLYEWWGKAAETDETSPEDSGTLAYGYGRSGQDMPDRIKYMAIMEYAPFDFIELKAGVSGWLAVEEYEKNSTEQATWEDLKPYQHNVLAGIQYLFMGSDSPKKKLALQVAVPYSVKNMTAPDYTTSLSVMWTF